MNLSTLSVGTFCFGLLIGFITYRTLSRTEKASISDLATVIGAVGGGAVTALVQPQTSNFGWYAIGLLIGFAVYGLLYRLEHGKEAFAKVMGNTSRPLAQSGEANARHEDDQDD